MPAVFYGGHFSCCGGRGIYVVRAGGRGCVTARKDTCRARCGTPPSSLTRCHLPLQGRHLKPPLERLPCKGSWRQGRLRGALPLCIRGIFQNQTESCPASPRDAACIVPRGLGGANPAGGNKCRPRALYCRAVVHVCRKGLRRKNAAVLHKSQPPDPFIRGQPAVRGRTSPPPSTGSPTPRTPVCQRPAPGRQ